MAGQGDGGNHTINLGSPLNQGSQMPNQSMPWMQPAFQRGAPVQAGQGYGGMPNFMQNSPSIGLFGGGYQPPLPVFAPFQFGSIQQSVKAIQDEKAKSAADAVVRPSYDAPVYDLAQVGG
jgi:hypothetical protein